MTTRRPLLPSQQPTNPDDIRQPLVPTATTLRPPHDSRQPPVSEGLPAEPPSPQRALKEPGPRTGVTPKAASLPHSHQAGPQSPPFPALVSYSVLSPLPPALSRDPHAAPVMAGPHPRPAALTVTPTRQRAPPSWRRAEAASPRPAQRWRRHCACAREGGADPLNVPPQRRRHDSGGTVLRDREEP